MFRKTFLFFITELLVKLYYFLIGEYNFTYLSKKKKRKKEISI